MGLEPIYERTAWDHGFAPVPLPNNDVDEPTEETR